MNGLHASKKKFIELDVSDQLHVGSVSSSYIFDVREDKATTSQTRIMIYCGIVR